MTSRHLWPLTFLILLLCFAFCRSKPLHFQRFEYSQPAMGVRARMVVYTSNQRSAERSCKAAFERIAQLDGMMSDYQPDSELMRLCAKAGGPPMRVSKELLFVLRKSQQLSRLSDGAFDVTVGPVVRLWRQARKTGKLPPRDELDTARKLVDWRRVIINEKAGTVRLIVPGMRLDLGGIAKGYACDEALRVLKREGIRSALVEMGGDIAVSGPPPGKRGWEIEIPNATNVAHKRVALSHAAVSSSGDTEQYVEIGGKRYSHIVDPHTGLGLTSRIAVTVIALKGVTSDGLSTAVSVLGARRGRELVRKFPGARVYIRSAASAY